MRRKNQWIIIGLVLIALFTLPAFGALSDLQINAGLKEALQVGTQNAVKLVGKENGYFNNTAIKIPLPEKMQKWEKTLRKLGFGPQIDEFVLSMNRAAEQAAPSAKQIFWDAIKSMSFEDARKILFGGDDTAATKYFQAKTGPKLIEAFKPIVSQATDKVGVTRKYKALEAKAEKISFLKTRVVDIDEYVVTKATDGLFYVLADEERKIRKDPVKRVTKLLQDVFGH